MATLKQTTSKPAERTVQSDKAPQFLTVELGGKEFEPADRKTFSSGSTGYHSQGKTVIAGQKYQVNLTVTLIGSKPQ